MQTHCVKPCTCHMHTKRSVHGSSQSIEGGAECGCESRSKAICYRRFICSSGDSNSFDCKLDPRRLKQRLCLTEGMTSMLIGDHLFLPFPFPFIVEWVVLIPNSFHSHSVNGDSNPGRGPIVYPLTGLQLTVVTPFPSTPLRWAWLDGPDTNPGPPPLPSRRGQCQQSPPPTAARRRNRRLR